jgi:hypothetical protein
MKYNRITPPITEPTMMRMLVVERPLLLLPLSGVVFITGFEYALNNDETFKS